MLLSPQRRPLTTAERRLLHRKIGSLRSRSRRTSRAYLPVAAGIVLVLWAWTLLASDAPPVVVTAFWLLAGGLLGLWVRRDMRRDARRMRAMAGSLESALRRNEADVYDIRAHAFVEFEEIEDEGACYAFALEGERLVFISGQEFYPEARFPSLDFSLVYVLDRKGRAVDMVIEKRGGKARPVRTIPGFVKPNLDLPDHLAVRTGRLEDLADMLRRSVA
jgi:hypothetical protein